MNNYDMIKFSALLKICSYINVIPGGLVCVGRHRTFILVAFPSQNTWLVV
jgi:hypothetical protein